MGTGKEHFKNHHWIKYYSLLHPPFSRDILRESMPGINSLPWSKIYPCYFDVIFFPFSVPPFGVLEANDMAESLTSSSLSQPSEDPTEGPFASFYVCLSHTTLLIRSPGCHWEEHSASLSLSQFENVNNTPKPEHLRSGARLEQTFSAVNFPGHCQWVRNTYFRQANKNH